MLNTSGFISKLNKTSQNVSLRFSKIIKVSFIHQLMHQWVVLKNNIKIYIKISDMFRCYSYTIIRERISSWLLQLQLKWSIKILRCVDYFNCNFS